MELFPGEGREIFCNLNLLGVERFGRVNRPAFSVYFGYCCSIVKVQTRLPKNNHDFNLEICEDNILLGITRRSKVNHPRPKIPVSVFTRFPEPKYIGVVAYPY